MSKTNNIQKPDDLPAFVEAYFSHLSFAPQVPKEFHTFLKGHLNAFALVMRAKYTPRIEVRTGNLTPSEQVELANKPCSIMVQS